MYLKNKTATILLFISLALAACTTTSVITSESELPKTSVAASSGHSGHKESPGNIFRLLSRDLHLPDETTLSPAVDKQLAWFSNHPEFITRVAENARPYLHYIYHEVKKRKLPLELVLLPMIESHYDPFAYSKAGAAGLWQMMPGTATGFGLKLDWWYDGRRDIIASTQSALDYLAYLGNFFNGNWFLAIAAYDTGEGSVVSAISKNIKAGESVDFWNLPLPSETQNYIPKLLALTIALKHPRRYNITWPDIPDTPYFEKVEVGSQLDLTEAAEILSMDIHELLQLNPGFNRRITHPQGPHHLLLPIEKASLFQKVLAHLPKPKQPTWLRYTVQANDTLSSISRQFKVSIKVIQQTNALTTSTIRVGQVLLVPTEGGRLLKMMLTQDHAKNPKISDRIHDLHITEYYVKPGDTLEKISKKFHVKPKEICFWNNIRSSKDLRPKQKLMLWPVLSNSTKRKGSV